MAVEAQVLVQSLLACQNPDGGWSYNNGSSWAEPTAFALLALQSQQAQFVSPAIDRGVSWLLSQQKASGGWAPSLAVNECTSVTSIATMAILPSNHNSIDQALTWTSNQIYKDGLSLSLLLARTLHLPPAHAPGSVPWYPGTAGWVTPTALTALTLLRAAKERQRPEFHALAAESCSYLLSRRCIDSGWNHGGSKTRSEDATSYPETTGLALLALRAASILQPADSVTLARKFASHPESIEGLSWIQMALQSHDQPVPDPKPLPKARTTRDIALRLIALNAQNGRNILLSAQSAGPGPEAGNESPLPNPPSGESVVRVFLRAWQPSGARLDKGRKRRASAPCVARVSLRGA